MLGQGAGAQQQPLFMNEQLALAIFNAVRAERPRPHANIVAAARAAKGAGSTADLDRCNSRPRDDGHSGPARNHDAVITPDRATLQDGSRTRILGSHRLPAGARAPGTWQEGSASFVLERVDQEGGCTRPGGGGSRWHCRGGNAALGVSIAHPDRDTRLASVSGCLQWQRAPLVACCAARLRLQALDEDCRRGSERASG